MRSGMQGPERVKHNFTQALHRRVAQQIRRRVAMQELQRSLLRSFKAIEGKSLEDPSDAKDSVLHDPSSMPLT